MARGDGRRWEMALLGALSIVAGLLLSLSSTRASASPSRLRVTVAPAAMVPAGARAAGSQPRSGVISGAVVLRPRDNASLVGFIAAVSDPRSAQFGHYLPAGSFAARFGPAASTVAAVREALGAAGVTVTGVSSDGLLVRFEAPAERIDAAFGTHLERYRLADGRSAVQADSPITLPADIAGSVAAVLGLDQTVSAEPLGLARARPALLARHRRSHAGPRTARFYHPAGSPNPCSEATGAARALGGLTDDQIAGAYGAFGLYREGDYGAGVHIALYEQEPFLRSDIRTFDTCYFGARRAAAMMGRLHVISVEGGQTQGPGSGEALLDVENVSAIAPGATIDVYESPGPNANSNVYDGVSNYAAIIDRDQDQILSTSWGLCEQAVQSGQPGLQEAENFLFEQAAAQGQSVFSAAGDNGSDDCNANETSTPVKGQNPVSVDDPASQPYVIGVGGTTILNAAADPAQEQVWNDGVRGGAGGGGISSSWAMPAWQRASLVPGIAGPGGTEYRAADAIERRYGYRPGFCASSPDAGPGTPCRLVPDVAADADEYTGAITVYSQSDESSMTPDGWTTSGGTSSAAPIWAASTALIDDSPACAVEGRRNGVGFLAPLLYAVASDPAAYAASFNDIRSGSNDIYGLDGSGVFPATRGYDLASGLGSPRLTDAGGTAGLAYYLCSLAGTPSRPSVTRLTPATAGVGGGELVAIHGSGFRSGGRDLVRAVQIGARQLTAGQFAVRSATLITLRLPPARRTLPPNTVAPQSGAAPVEVMVTLSNGASSLPGPASRLIYLAPGRGTPAPSVEAIDPSGGGMPGGARVTIFGSGFARARRVTFGGVSARFKVVSAGRIVAIAPRFSGRTVCARLPHTGAFAHEGPDNDICQSFVRVSGPGGISASGSILPPIEGPLSTTTLGVFRLPAGCRCEQGPAPDEYDYAPKPRITWVSTFGGAGALADENGGTLITIRGRGFNAQTIDWATLGAPGQEASVDVNWSYLSGTEMQLVVPAQGPTSGIQRIALRIRTLAGESNPAPVSYAGFPTVKGIEDLHSAIRYRSIPGAPNTGGSPLLLSGAGLTSQVQLVRFLGLGASAGESEGTQRSFTIGHDGLRADTVAQNPALVGVGVCTASGCSPEVDADRLYLYPLGSPKVVSVSPSSGPASGGSAVTIAGSDLGCPLAVDFGSAAATRVRPDQLLACGQTARLHADSPAGPAGSKVPVRVLTAESYFTGRGLSATAASFTYTGP